MVSIMNSFWSNFNAFADFMYAHVPLLSSYTMKQKQRIMSTFQEDNYDPGQKIFRERGDLPYIFLIVEG
jgi:hypothetical protein